MEIIFIHGIPHFAFNLPGDVPDFIFVQIYLLYSAFVSLLAFAVYGIDKARAQIKDPRKRKRRIPERTLLILAFAGGAFGAAAGMLFFHHKTRKRKFGILVPSAVVLWIVGFLASIFLFGTYHTFQ